MKKIFLLCGIILLSVFINTAKADDTYYTVVISSVKSAQSAQIYADEVSKKGFEANVMLVKLSKGNTNRVCIGKYSTKARAEEEQKKLEKAGFSSSWIAVINGTDTEKPSAKPAPEKKTTPEIKTKKTEAEKAEPTLKKSKIKKNDLDEDVVKAEPTPKKSKIKKNDLDEDVVKAEPPSKKSKMKKNDIEIVKSEPVVKKSTVKFRDAYVDKGAVNSGKNNPVNNKTEKTSIPTPPDVDKLPLAVPKEFSGNKADNKNGKKTLDSNGYEVFTYNNNLIKDNGQIREVEIHELFTKENKPISGDTIKIVTSDSKDVVITRVPLENQPSSIISSKESDKPITNSLSTTSDDITISSGKITTTTLTNEPNKSIITDDKLMIRGEPMPIQKVTQDTLEILKKSSIEKETSPKSLAIKEGLENNNTVITGSKQSETLAATKEDALVANKVPTSKSHPSKAIESEKNPKLESLIPGTNLSYNQFYTEIKKIFYALERYSLASGTLLNEYIDPAYGTYIRYRDNDKIGFEKMVKPKDVYKNIQVKSNVLMFFQDMVKVRRQPPVIEPLPNYDCSLKHIPGLNIYLSSLSSDNKFYEETVKYLKSTGTNLTDEENEKILTANKTINAAFAIGSSELIKAVYFAISSDKVYLRYIDLYDNCEKK